MEPVLLRLQNVVPCSARLLARVQDLASRSETFPARTILQTEDSPVRRPRYLVAGWAFRFRTLRDGRRQIFDLVLPGEGVGLCLRPHPLASTNTEALTQVVLVDAAPLLQAELQEGDGEFETLLRAHAHADERRMLDQIVRLGRLTALERIAHLMLDLRRRLEVVGHVDGDRFPLPLTQEILADIAGLSVVHVNRTLQELRRQELLRIERGYARVPNPAALALMAGYEAEPFNETSGT